MVGVGETLGIFLRQVLDAHALHDVERQQVSVSGEQFFVQAHRIFVATHGGSRLTEYWVAFGRFADCFIEERAQEGKVDAVFVGDEPCSGYRMIYEIAGEHRAEVQCAALCGIQSAHVA